ncbi:sugar ABC transporter ATP-binding protein [Micromonospora sp. NPDC007271]|uniref:sugar ABC transporter ATP-binding protein n=1 Tax=Micromonospora sp. NPDC007271 TaxID=3154587 RepID=UPI0033FC2BD0
MTSTGSGLRMDRITKVFPGTVALDEVAFEVRAGEVHGLVGENGAGKSTLIKILSGMYTADEGRITLGGHEVTIGSPADAEKHGIMVIHQDRQLVPKLTVGESLFLGRAESTNGPLVSRRQLSRRAREVLRETVGVDIPGDTLIQDLSVAKQQLVQISRALMSRPKVLILDEPTAPLAQQEVDRLFAILADLKSKGEISIIYISHYLQEVAEICERVTVLRNGRNAGAVEMATTSLDEVVTLMVGRDVEEFSDRPQRRPEGPPRLELDGLTAAGRLDEVSLAVRGGEVVGVTGLIGSGADDLAAAIVGLIGTSAGTVSIDGKPQRNRNPYRLSRRGVACVPADRRRDGAVMAMSVRENLSMAALRRLSKLGMLRLGAERAEADDTIKRLSIRPGAPDVAVRDLSGGNQQKVVLGKWLVRDADVFILDQPTSGVDIGSRAEIYRIIDSLAEAGKAVLVISQDLPELVGVSDRVLVMYRGRVAAELDRSEAAVDLVLALSTGAETRTTAPAKERA